MTTREEALREALTSEDEIAHGEAWNDTTKSGLGVCAYCDGEWPCRTQRGINRLLERLATPDAPADPRQPHGVSGLFQHEPGQPCVVCDRLTPDAPADGQACGYRCPHTQKVHEQYPNDIDHEFTPDAPADGKHDPGEPHHYEMHCTVCGWLGQLRISVEPQVAE